MKLEINPDHVVAHATTLLGGSLASHGITKAHYAPGALDSDPVVAAVFLTLLASVFAAGGAILSEAATE